MAKIIDADNRQPMDPIAAKFREYVSLKKQIDELTKRQSDIKPELMAYAEANGIEDDKGHYIYYVDEDVDGYVSMQKQRRVSFGYDEDAAKRILTDKGLWEQCTTQVRILNEDALLAAHWEGALSEQDIDAIRPQKVTWAFVPLKK
jgi:hypothetical protein